MTHGEESSSLPFLESATSRLRSTYFWSGHANVDLPMAMTVIHPFPILPDAETSTFMSALWVSQVFVRSWAWVRSVLGSQVEEAVSRLVVELPATPDYRGFVLIFWIIQVEQDGVRSSLPGILHQTRYELVADNRVAEAS